MAAALQALASRLQEGKLAREVVGLWTALSRAPAPGNERKWRFDAIEALLRHRLLPLSDLDTQTAEVRWRCKVKDLVADQLPIVLLHDMSAGSLLSVQLEIIFQSPSIGTPSIACCNMGGCQLWHCRRLGHMLCPSRTVPQSRAKNVPPA